jgi:alternate signal-mediated exported protein
MKKTTKGALAVAAAAVLLTGSAGTLAFWTDDDQIDGGLIRSGHIELLAADCTEEDWLHVEDDETVVNMVPGDHIYKLCDATLDLLGDHIGATVEVTDASITAVQNELASEVEVTSELQGDSVVTGEGVHDVQVRIDVLFPYEAATNASQTGIASLDTLDLTAVQIHDPDPAPAP